MATATPKDKIKIVYLDSENPSKLYSRFFENEAAMNDYVDKFQVSDYLVSKLDDIDNTGRYKWTIDKEIGLGKNFIKGYKYYQSMKTRDSQVAFYLLSFAGGALTFVLAKKIIGNAYIAGALGIAGAFATQYGIISYKTR